MSEVTVTTRDSSRGAGLWGERLTLVEHERKLMWEWERHQRDDTRVELAITRRQLNDIEERIQAHATADALLNDANQRAARIVEEFGL